MFSPQVSECCKIIMFLNLKSQDNEVSNILLSEEDVTILFVPRKLV